MPLAPDLHAIAEAKDRSWTTALLAELPSLGHLPEKLEEVSECLRRLGDLRALPSLQALVADSTQAEVLRRAAGGIVESYDLPLGYARSTWELARARGDSILAEHALGCMDREEEDIVVLIADDDHHPLQLAALTAMETRFEEPKFQAIRVRALSHPNPAIRAQVARGLLWDEPILAEGPLISLLDDPHENVACEAADTLRYYGSKRVLKALLGLRDRADRLGEVARASVEEICWRLECDLTPRTSTHFRQWLGVLWDPLDLSVKQDRTSTPSTRSGPEYDRLSAKQLQDEWFDLDGAWGVKLRRFECVDPLAFAPTERAEFTRLFLSHPDPEFVSDACRWLAAWNDRETLLTLLDRPYVGVQKAAAYWLVKTDPSAEVAHRMWQRLSQRSFCGITLSTETLETWAHHETNPHVRIERLVELARSDWRESVRTGAIYELARIEARTELESLAPLFACPPEVTWAMHIALLNGFRTCGLALPTRGAWYDADDIHMQAEIALIA